MTGEREFTRVCACRKVEACPKVEAYS